MSIKIISVLIILNFCAFLKCEIVEIEDGKLEGTVLKTRKKLDVYAFLKIPFAEPPIGKLRFQPPISNKKWEGILNAKQFGPACMQYYNGPDGGVSEDCLQLNVFTKELNSVDLKPTIVYIHGGVSSDCFLYKHLIFYNISIGVRCWICCWISSGISSRS